MYTAQTNEENSKMWVPLNKSMQQKGGRGLRTMYNLYVKRHIKRTVDTEDNVGDRRGI